MLNDPQVVSDLRESYVMRKLDELVIEGDVGDEVQGLLEKVKTIVVGKERAMDYQKAVSRLLGLLFDADLSDPHTEVRNITGTSRYDIVFLNNATSGFWHDLKIGRGNAVVIFDTKNTTKLRPEDCNQMLRYSSNWRGNVVFIVCRVSPQTAFERRATELLKEKDVCVLVLGDQDLERMCCIKRQGGKTTDVLAEKLRARIEGS